MTARWWARTASGFAVVMSRAISGLARLGVSAGGWWSSAIAVSGTRRVRCLLSNAAVRVGGRGLVTRPLCLVVVRLVRIVRGAMGRRLWVGGGRDVSGA